MARLLDIYSLKSPFVIRVFGRQVTSILKDRALLPRHCDRAIQAHPFLAPSLFPYINTDPSPAFFSVVMGQVALAVSVNSFSVCKGGDVGMQKSPTVLFLAFRCFSPPPPRHFRPQVGHRRQACASLSQCPSCRLCSLIFRL